MMAETASHVTEMTVGIRVPNTGQQLMFVYNDETQAVGIKGDVQGDGNYVLITEMPRAEFRRWATDLAAWATMLLGI